MLQLKRKEALHVDFNLISHDNNKIMMMMIGIQYNEINEETIR